MTHTQQIAILTVSEFSGIELSWYDGEDDIIALAADLYREAMGIMQDNVDNFEFDDVDDIQQAMEVLEVGCVKCFLVCQASDIEAIRSFASGGYSVGGDTFENYVAELEAAFVEIRRCVEVPDQISFDGAMTVADLMAKLVACDPAAVVVLGDTEEAGTATIEDTGIETISTARELSDVWDLDQAVYGFAESDCRTGVEIVELPGIASAEQAHGPSIIVLR